MGANLTRYVDETEAVFRRAPREWSNRANSEVESIAGRTLARLQSAILPPVEQITPRGRAAPPAFECDLC